MSTTAAAALVITGTLAIIGLLLWHRHAAAKIAREKNDYDTAVALARLETLRVDMAALDDRAQLDRVDRIVDDLTCDDPDVRVAGLAHAESLDADWAMLTRVNLGRP